MIYITGLEFLINGSVTEMFRGLGDLIHDCLVLSSSLSSSSNFFSLQIMGKEILVCV